MKNLVIYHRDCTDGLVAYLCAEQSLGVENCEGFPAHYEESPPVDLAIGKAVYVLDFSYPPEQLKLLARVAHKVVVLDHHLTAYKQLCADPAAIISQAREDRTCFTFADTENLLARINMDQSGAMMSYEYFCRGWSHLLDFARYAEDRDLWRFQLHHSRAINAFLSALPYDDLSVWKEELGKGFERMVEPGQAILRWVNKMVANTAKLAKSVFIDDEYRGTLVAVVCNVLPAIRSEVAGLIAKDGDFGVGWWFDGSRGVYVYALRSNGTFDVEEFARRRGGGGHKQAAAFESSYPVHENNFENVKVLRLVQIVQPMVTLEPRTDIPVIEASVPPYVV